LTVSIRTSYQFLSGLKDGSFLLGNSHGRLDRKVTALRTGAYTHNQKDDETGPVPTIGTFIGHSEKVTCAIEKSDNIIITGSIDGMVKVWNKSTCKCLHTMAMESLVYSLLKTKTTNLLLCGLGDGTVRVVRLIDYHSVDSISVGPLQPIYWICELEDGTLCIAAWKELVIWDIMKRRKLRTFKEAGSWAITKVLEVKSDVIVSISDDRRLKIWRVSTGECLHNCEHQAGIYGLVKLKDGCFASGSEDKTIKVWDEHGVNIATYLTTFPIGAMAILQDGSLAVLTHRLEIWTPCVIHSSFTVESHLVFIMLIFSFPKVDCY